MNTSCKYCGGALHESEQTFRDNTKHIRVTCRECGRFQQYRKQAKNGFIMPFGKHRGRSIPEIVRIDPDYATWAAGNLSSNIRERFNTALEINGKRLCQSS